MVNIADVNDGNRLENQMGEDLDPKWNEPSTRGDLRLLAIRIDTKFDQLRGEFSLHTSEMDSKFEQLRGDFRLHTSEIDSKFDLLRGDFRVLANGVDSKFEQSRSDMRVIVTETDAKLGSSHAEFTRTMYRGGMIFASAIITANLAMLSIFATLIK